MGGQSKLEKENVFNEEIKNMPEEIPQGQGPATQ